MLLSCKKWFKHFHPLLAVASGQDLMDELTPGGELTLNLCAFNGCPVRKRRKCTADGLTDGERFFILFLWMSFVRKTTK